LRQVCTLTFTATPLDLQGLSIDFARRNTAGLLERPRLDALDAAIAAQDVEAALALLAELLPEWKKGGGAGAVS
jgi:hypothetical protein